MADFNETITLQPGTLSFGLPGEPGITPHIGDNGNWFLADLDTGVHAQGPKGDPGITPEELQAIYDSIADIKGRAATKAELAAFSEYVEERYQTKLRHILSTEDGVEIGMGVPVILSTQHNVLDVDTLAEDVQSTKTGIATLIQNAAMRSDLPTKVSQLQNDSEYVTQNYVGLNYQPRLKSGENIATVNGHALTDGGNVEIREVSLDSTLSFEGYAADSKAVGDAIASNRIRHISDGMDDLLLGDEQCVGVTLQTQNTTLPVDDIATKMQLAQEHELASNAFADIDRRLATKQETIADLATIRQGAGLGMTALQKQNADELYQPIGQYVTRTEVINLINEYLKWGDGLITLTYQSLEGEETILFNQNILNSCDIIEIDGTEVDSSVFSVRNISGPRLSTTDSITNPMAHYRFATAGEHIIRLKFAETELPSYGFWNTPRLFNIELPTRVTSTQTDAITWLSNLRTLLLSDNLVTIGERFCFHCISLQSFAFPNKVTQVPNAALTTCSSITSLTLGKSMTSEKITSGENVGAWSLGDLFGLSNIYIKGDNPTFATGLSSGSTVCFWNAGRDVPSGTPKNVFYEGNGSFPASLRSNTWLRGWNFYERGVKIN